MVAICHGPQPTPTPSAVVIFDYGTSVVFGCNVDATLFLTRGDADCRISRSLGAYTSEEVLRKMFSHTPHG